MSMWLSISECVLAFPHREPLFTFTRSGLVAGNLRVCVYVCASARGWRHFWKVGHFGRSSLSQRAVSRLNSLMKAFAETCSCRSCTVKGFLWHAGLLALWKLLSCLHLLKPWRASLFIECDLTIDFLYTVWKANTLYLGSGFGLGLGFVFKDIVCIIYALKHQKRPNLCYIFYWVVHWHLLKCLFVFSVQTS